MSCRILKAQTAADPVAVDFFRHLADRSHPDSVPDVEGNVRAILDAVAAKGDEALLEQTRRFDCPTMELPLAVGPDDLQRAAASIPADDLDIMAEAAAHIREFHEAQKERSWFMTRPDGTMLGQKVEPVDRAGL